MSGPSAVLWVEGSIALAALEFAGSGVGALPKFTSLGSQLFRYRRSIVTGCLLCDRQHAHDPWRSTDHHQGSFGSGGRSCRRSLEFIFSHHRQSEFETGPPSMFGASPRMPDLIIEQRALNIDGGAGTARDRFDGNLESLGFLRHDVTRTYLKIV